MKEQIASRMTLDLGPFLTLLLLASSRDSGRPVPTVAGKVTLAAVAHEAGIAMQQHAVEGESTMPPFAPTGLFLSLVLSSLKTKSGAGPERAAVTAHSSYSRCPQPQSELYWLRSEVHSAS